MEQLLNGYIALVSGTHPLLWLIIFALCLVGESVGLSLPYILETTWLMAGFLLGSHQISLLTVLPMLLAAIFGRLAGMTIFYVLVGAGSTWFFRRFPNMKTRLDDSTFSQKLNSRHWTVPLWIALGRLLWMRIPISIVMTLSRRYWALSIGLVISALVFELTYVIIGLKVGNSVNLSPIQLVPYLLIGVTISFGVGFGAHRLWSIWRSRVASRS